jgi:putative flavoprotein involved in K+ transport
MSDGGARNLPATGTTDVVVIGAGHSGLAMSAWLSAHSIDHVVLERGEIANSWRHERWDSLRLLTPNWMSRLPGYRYAGDNPDDAGGDPVHLALRGIHRRAGSHRQPGTVRARGR